MPSRFRIATGHQLTTQAAADVLQAGGNAVDGLCAALLTACVAEPMLASLGGGGHALIKSPSKPVVCLDCFAQTPKQKQTKDVDFYSILGNFGTTTQEFHVGLGSVATPGLVAGLDALHQRFGSIPKKRLIEPAKHAARHGVALNTLQHHTLQILEPIVRASTAAARWAGLSTELAPLPEVGSSIRNPNFADFLDLWASEGARCFYQGPIAERLIQDATERGGHLRHADLESYGVRWRRALKWNYRNATVWSNPPPAFGGMMLALSALALEQSLAPGTAFGSAEHLRALVQAMSSVNAIRHRLEDPKVSNNETALRRAFFSVLDRHALVCRGTTHISIDDGKGLWASMTVSNGEGSGYVLEDAGIMLNNMLGEQDINRAGFGSWPLNRRLSSMMAPTIIEKSSGKEHFLLGSGGSNRIRSALLQVLSNLNDFDMDLATAIDAPRVHLEEDHLSVELASQWSPSARQWWEQHHPDATLWPGRSLFFGGVHATGLQQASADPRREGSALAEPH